jgi:hypothetical protein
MIEIELEQLWQSIGWPLLDRLAAARLSDKSTWQSARCAGESI